MLLPHLLVVLSLTLLSRCYQPPQIEAIVNEILEEYNDYVHYNGTAVGVPEFVVQEVELELEKRQGGSYWYEQIAHRGISAFGPPGYQVYRNVKDYGARGLYFHLHMEVWTAANENDYR